MLLDFVERPEFIKDCLGMDHLKKDLYSFLKTGNCPHLLFIGPPGCGKNTFAYAFAREYLGRPISINTEEGDHDYKEINCSLLTGVDTIREVISDFLKTMSNTFRDGVRLKKILFLNEFEKLSDVAKGALKVEIEKYENNVIVIFATNYENAIKEDALASRLCTYRFKRCTHSELKDWFIGKANKYDVNFKPESLVDDIVDFYNGDMRRMLIDCLEALRGYPQTTGLAGNDDTGTYGIWIKKEDLHKIYENSTENYADQVVKSSDPKATWTRLWKDDYFDNRKFLEDYMKFLGGNYSKIFAKIDSRLRRGCNDMIQMCALFDIIGEMR